MGCSRSLCAASTDEGSAWHGEDGLGNTGLGATSTRDRVVATEHASCAMLRLAREGAARHTPVSILTLGPLTNLALALRLGSVGGAPLEAILARVVVMGGAYQAYGNVSPAAEFNVLEDPEAASAVLSTKWAAGCLVDLVTWELTKSLGLFPPALEAWLRPPSRAGSSSSGSSSAGPPSRAAFLARVSDYLIAKSKSWNPEMYAQYGFHIPDPLAACVAVDPTGVIAESAVVGVLVETAGKWGRGGTFVDWSGGCKDGQAPACVRLVKAVHRAAVEALLCASTAEAL